MIGRAEIVATARELGVTEAIPQDLTLALGTGPMSLVQLTAAYAAVASGTAPVVAHGLPGARPPAGAHRLGERALAGMRDLLRSAVHRGTGVEAAIPGAFGKTGTTQNYRDAIFVGYVGDLVVGVWVGNDDNSAMRGVVGGGLPARIWREVVTYAVARDAPPPPALIETPSVDSEAVIEPEQPPALSAEGLEAEAVAPPDAEGLAPRLAVPAPPPGGLRP
jgi:membrane peptidoglycan carboxypeptidase